MRTLVGASTLAALATLVAALAAAPAGADQWGSQNATTGAHPDEGPHTFCYGSSFPQTDVRDRVELAEYNALEGPTQANVNYHSTCTNSGTSETDVVWQEGDLSGNTLGKAPCDDYELLGDQCDQYHATIDLGAINVGDLDSYHQEAIACHEL